MKKTQLGGIYFAAMNTGEGFKSCFSEIFGSLKKLYIVKGGPGTGKSRFMKEVGAEAEARGYVTEKYLCSSDPTSLDGIVIPELSFGIIDGTAPHTYEPVLSGAKDNIIDLGRFWSSELLREHLDEIKEISRRKAKLYGEIYTYLKAVSGYDSIIKGCVNDAIEQKKLEATAKKLACSLGNGNRAERKIKIRTAISDDGVITLSTFAKNAERRFALLDSYGIGGIFLSALLKETEKKGLACTVSYSPFSPLLPDAIYYPDSGTSFYVGAENDFEESVVNMRRFINDALLRPYKAKIRAVSRLKKAALGELFIDFSSVKRLHSELETIYGKAMNFRAKESYTESFIESLFGN